MSASKTNTAIHRGMAEEEDYEGQAYEADSLTQEVRAWGMGDAGGPSPAACRLWKRLNCLPPVTPAKNHTLHLAPHSAT